MKGVALGSVMVFASGRPFGPELYAANIIFKIVPGEGFTHFADPA